MKKLQGVVLVTGKPNVGKSTLVNLLAKKKMSATSSKADTTKQILPVYFEDKRSAVLYLDSPGYHKNLVHQVLDEANLVLMVTTPKRWGEIDHTFALLCQERNIPMVLIVNKVDRREAWKDLESFFSPITARYGFADVLYVSAKQGHHLELIKKLISKYLTREQIAFIPNRTIETSVEEIIREKIFRTLHQEIPHKLVIKVEIIDSIIWGFITYSKQSHKKIILGQRGATLSLLRNLCQKDIKAILGLEQNLRLHLRGKL